MMRDGTMYDQRDIILFPFPFTDLTASKLRPAVIVSNNVFNTTQDRICCLITSNPQSSGIKIFKRDLQEGGLQFQSKVKPQRLFTVNRRIIVKKLGKIRPNFHTKIEEEIHKLVSERTF